MAKGAREYEARLRRHQRVRTKVIGTTERPRLSVYRSLQHIYAQIIDDSIGHTLISASTMDKTISGQAAGLKKSDEAKLVGRLLAERALANGVKKVVFDRGGFQYHGRVKALAEAAREAGLEF